MSYQSNPNIPTVNILAMDPVTKLVTHGTVTGVPPVVASIFAPQCHLYGIDGTGSYVNDGTAVSPVWSMSATAFNNVVLNAPGLQIHGASSALVKSVNTFGVRVNGILGVPVTARDMPSLATATLPNGNTVGNLAFDNGTVPPTTPSCQMYTFLCAVNPTTGATTLSVVAGNAFPKDRPVNVLTDVNLGDGSKAVVGFLYVKNETAAVFIPGTTDLDVSGLTTSYSDAFGYPLIGAPTL